MFFLLAFLPLPYFYPFRVFCHLIIFLSFLLSRFAFHNPHTVAQYTFFSFTFIHLDKLFLPCIVCVSWKCSVLSFNTCLVARHYFCGSCFSQLLCSSVSVFFQFFVIFTHVCIFHFTAPQYSSFIYWFRFFFFSLPLSFTTFVSCHFTVTFSQCYLVTFFSLHLIITSYSQIFTLLLSHYIISPPHVTINFTSYYILIYFSSQNIPSSQCSLSVTFPLFSFPTAFLFSFHFSSYFFHYLTRSTLHNFTHYLEALSTSTILSIFSYNNPLFSVWLHFHVTSPLHIFSTTEHHPQCRASYRIKKYQWIQQSFPSFHIQIPSFPFNLIPT